MAGFADLAAPGAGFAPGESALRHPGECAPPNRRRRGRPAARAGKRRRSAGFTFIGLLVLVALMGITLAVVGQVWQTVRSGEKEDELLYAGDEFRRAIGLYVANTPAGADRYPRRLEDLLRDPRYPGVRRYLRRIYRDPITGGAEWGLVKAGDFIMGVHSLSEKEPLKKGAFLGADKGFEGKTKYSEWVFSPGIGQGPAGLPPGGPGTPGIVPPPQPGTLPVRPSK